MAYSFCSIEQYAVNEYSGLNCRFLEINGFVSFEMSTKSVVGTDFWSNFNHRLCISSVGFAKVSCSISLVLLNGVDLIELPKFGLFSGLTCVVNIVLYCCSRSFGDFVLPT